MSREYEVEIISVAGKPQVEARIDLTSTQFGQDLVLFLDSDGKTIDQLKIEALQTALSLLKSEAEELQSYLERRNL